MPPAADSVVRLRAHHVLCLLTFVGEGYSREFIDNFRHVLARLEAGVPIVLVAGIDDICAGLCAQPASQHCTQASVAMRDATARTQLAHVRGLGPLLDDGGRVTLDTTLLAALRRQFASGEIRGACVGCEWSPLCTRIAADAFGASVLAAG